jgi:putative ABC transport system permease protein
MTRGWPRLPAWLPRLSWARVRAWRPSWRRRLAVRDLLDEALAGVAARPARLALLTLGTVLGIAALVTTIGIGQTAAGQITQRFDEAVATRVVVEAQEGRGPGDDEVALTRLPWDASERLTRLNGVVAAGTYARVDIGDAEVRGLSVADPAATASQVVPVAAASPGLFAALRAELRGGRLYDTGHDARGDPVVVLGRYAAERLGIDRVDAQPSIFVGDRPFTVIGILATVGARAELLDSAIMPVGTARSGYGLTALGAVEIRTELGAAQLVARQAPVAIDPNQPELLQVTAPPRPGELRRDVVGEVNALFLVLGGVALLVGGLGIANVTLLSVLERISEIGLRRAVGATRVHIAGQFLVESVIVGLLGGLIGATVGVLATVGASAVQDWTPLLDMRLALGAPLLGAVIGLLAGTYPAWRAATIEPIAALRA